MIKLNEKQLKEIAIKAEKKASYYDEVKVDVNFIEDCFAEEIRTELTLLVDGEAVVEEVLFEGQSKGKAYNIAKQAEAFFSKMLASTEVEVEYRKSVWA